VLEMAAAKAMLDGQQEQRLQLSLLSDAIIMELINYYPQLPG
jgi:hypothetical protein